MSKIYKGWELIEEAAKGNIRQNAKFITKDKYNINIIYKYDCFWDTDEDEELGSSILIAHDFEKIEAEPEIDIQEIKELEYVEDYEVDKTDVRLNRGKINELVRAVKQLDKQITGDKTGDK